MHDDDNMMDIRIYGGGGGAYTINSWNHMALDTVL